MKLYSKIIDSAYVLHCYGYCHQVFVLNNTVHMFIEICPKMNGPISGTICSPEFCPFASTLENYETINNKLMKKFSAE